jgi:cytochrome c oxidase cbb3-type subunit 3
MFLRVAAVASPRLPGNLASVGRADKVCYRPAVLHRAVPLLLWFASLACGCDRAPSEDTVREWSPSDHDRVEEKARTLSGAQAAAQPKQGPRVAGDAGKQDDQAAVVELTWKNQCSACHGPLGHGDGPNGPMVKAPDLTRAEWQGKVTDAEMAATIKNGKNQMPRFDLSDKVVAGLVARIRATASAASGAPVRRDESERH